eukprot:jgi/Chlat1/3134/Chrsp21S03362
MAHARPRPPKQPSMAGASAAAGWATFAAAGSSSPSAAAAAAVATAAPSLLLLLACLYTALADDSVSSHAQPPDHASPSPPPPPAQQQCLKSVAGRLPFTRSTPGRASDLTFCHGHRHRTCCGRAQTDVIRRLLANARGELSPDCWQEWSALECAVCDPRLGTDPSHGVCEGFCGRLFRACAENFFTVDTVNGLLRPCINQDLVCSKLSALASTRSELCQLAGFAVTQQSGDCYNGGVDPHMYVDDKRDSGRESSSGKRPSGKEGQSSQQLAWLQQAGLAAAVAVGPIVVQSLAQKEATPGCSGSQFA